MSPHRTTAPPQNGGLAFIYRPCRSRRHYLTCFVPPPELMNVVSQGNTMTSHPYFLFNKTLEQLRHLGAHGGRIAGRNHRARRALMPPAPPASPGAEARETTVAAIATLDALFPWLRNAEKRPRRPSR